MNSEESPVGQALERFRPYLRVLARGQIDPKLSGKLDPSDVVQDTLVRAIRAQSEYRGSSDAELAGWLRQILVHSLANSLRDFAREKRDTDREQAIRAGIEQSSFRLGAWLATDASSPSEQAVRNEDLIRLADAIEALPESQREALTLHHLQRWTLDAVAEQMGRTPAAIAGLIKRAVRQLRQHLSADNQD
jgi:RNA polymerase sigma-70 factor (ECF subfamily)